MKRILLFVASLVASLNLLALTPTATATITLRGDVSGAYDQLILVESTTDGFTPGYENGYDVFQALNTPAIYAISGGDHFSTSMTNNLDNNAIGVKTGTDTEYTMTFSSVTGRSLTLYDLSEGKTVAIANAATYHFSATAGQSINDRFVLNIDVDTEPLETCFTGTELNIIHNPYFGKIVVKDGGGSTIKSYDYGTSSIDFNEKNAKGYYYYTNGADYTVSFGGARAFIVTVKR